MLLMLPSFCICRNTLVADDLKNNTINLMMPKTSFSGIGSFCFVHCDNYLNHLLLFLDSYVSLPWHAKDFVEKF